MMKTALLRTDSGALSPRLGGISDGGDELFDAVAEFVHKDICKREKEIKIRQAGRTDVKKGLQDRRGIFMEPGCV